MSDANQSCHRKKRYWTEGFASAVAQRVLEKRGVRVRVYRCSFCLGFHLTHKVPISAPQRATG